MYSRDKSKRNVAMDGRFIIFQKYGIFPLSVR